MKYQLHVWDTLGNVVSSVKMDEYPKWVLHIKDMYHFAMDVLDAHGKPQALIYNTAHIVSIMIQEIE